MKKSRMWVPVLVGALGYFVDIYDLVLFGILRMQSLRALGVVESQLLEVGVTLLNCQMAGMFLGGILWGVLGDKRGRLSVLFGSILLYSLANIANGFVQSVEAYAILRFIAGVGLAGELGAAITLVSETLPKDMRGYGTAIVGGVGLSGAIVAGLTTDHVDWRTSYFIGGALGLCLLILRLGVLESTMFLAMKEKSQRRGELKMLFTSKKRFLKYLACTLTGVPIWYVAGVVMTFSPEIAAELGVTGPVAAGRSIMYSYGGIVLGDFLTGFLSQWLRSRKKVTAYSIVAVALVSTGILVSRGLSPEMFYFLCAILGFCTGYWAIFVMTAAEQFGTNLRSTVTTSIPNFVRGSVVPLTLAFQTLGQHMSLAHSAMILGLSTAAVALFAVSQLEETHGRDLNFVES